MHYLLFLPVLVWLAWSAWFDTSKTDNDSIALLAIIGKVGLAIGTVFLCIALAVMGGTKVGWW